MLVKNCSFDISITDNDAIKCKLGEKVTRRKKRRYLDLWLQTNLEIKFVFMPSYYNWKKWQAASEQSTSGISDFYSGWRSTASDDLSLGITALCHLKHWANSSAHLEEKSLSLFLY